MSKIKVASLVNDFGLGGTPRQIVTLDKYLNKDIFEHVVIGLNSNDNTRRDHFSGKNIFSCRTPAEVVQVLSSQQVEVLHVHRHGRNEPAHDEVARLWGPTKQLVELNIFSAFDTGVFGQQCQKHMFPSATNVWKYCIQNGLEFDPTKHIAAFTLFDTANFAKHTPTSNQITALRQKWGAAKDAFVVGRLARPVMEKWDDETLIMWKKLSRCNPTAHFVALGVPESRQALLRSIGDAQRLTILPPTTSDQELALFYASIDVLAHASPIGECSSGTILEAMFFKKPVVVTSTPFPHTTGGRSHTPDNGQLDQIKNGVNGYVVQDGTAMAAALHHLSVNQQLVKTMGEQNARDVAEKFDVTVGLKTFEKTYLASAVQGGRVLTAAEQQYDNALAMYPSPQTTASWLSEYRHRLKDVYQGGNNSLFDQLQLLSWKIQKTIKRLLKIA